MGLWKDRIDAEIGKVSWDKHVVHEKINQKERGKKIYKIPFVLISIATIAFLLILTNQTIPLTQSSEQEKMSFLEKVQSSKVKAYYFSVFEPDGYYYTGVDDSYLGMKKGNKIKEMQAMLSNLTVLEDNKLKGYGSDMKEVIVHFENGTTHKVRVSFRQLYDVEAGITYEIQNRYYYTIFQGEHEQFTVFRWINGFFLLLMGINLLFTSLARKPIKEKFHLLFVLQLNSFLLLWFVVDYLFKNHFIFSKSVILTVYIFMVMIHCLLIYRLKLQDQLKRVEFYKMALYLVMMIFIWNKFFF